MTIPTNLSILTPLELEVLQQAIEVAWDITNDNITEPLFHDDVVSKDDIRRAAKQVDENVNRLIALTELRNRINRIVLHERLA